MVDTVIKVENLSKLYNLGEVHQTTNSFRDKVKGLFKKDGRPKKGQTIWALKDVSFKVKKGEILGIIGRNGAGKSTLLKILSRITKPTRGKVLINGRVGSLLEVGTGFHPELTGRENIYLNGSILGMKIIEIRKKIDEIVAFAELEKFLDTPVKRYSSGMYVRLAFAVAAHMEPEILLVDEVLAVGDIEFQKKCLGKMGNVAKEGRTVLLVSHNMGAIRSLCDNAIWIDVGRLKTSGEVDYVVTAYEDRIRYSSNVSISSIVKREIDDINNSNFYISRVETFDEYGKHSTTFTYNENITMIVDITGNPPTRAYNLEFRIHNSKGQFVGMGSSAFQGITLDLNTKQVKIEIGPIIFTNGRYTISFSVVDSLGGNRYDNWFNCFIFYITGCSPFGFGHELQQDLEGICALSHSITPINKTRD